MASQPPEHLQNDTGSQSLKANEYQQQPLTSQQENLPKLQNGGQPNPSNPQEHQQQQQQQQHGGKGMKSPPSNGNNAHGGPPNEMISGYHQEPNMGLPPSSQPMHQQAPPHMLHGAEKDEMQGPPHHQQQHPMYGQPMHPMHAPPQQHMPGHHLPMHPHQQRYHHPHAAGPPHGPMQHPGMHPHDPNQQQIDPYAHYRNMMGPRPPQRYGMPPQGPAPMPNSTQPTQQGAQQGPTPTLNSLLQSQPSPQQSPQSGLPPPHRYPNPNPYDPYAPPVAPLLPNSGSSSTHSQSQQQQAQQQQQQQQGWIPPRPYSPQQYRGPPPANSSRGQSPYPPPPSGVQSPGPYAVPNAAQQNQPPGPPQQYQYPQRYPTPPGNQGPQQPMTPQNHRPPYSQWPSPAASPGPHSNISNLGPPPSQSPHAPPIQSPGLQQTPQQAHGACSPSPQPPQSPHQYSNRPSQPSTPVANDNEMIGVNQSKKKNTSAKKKTKKQQKQEAAAAAQNSSNENSSNVALGNQQQQQPPPSNNAPQASGIPIQQPMRPISSPNSSSSGSRSMSPAVGQQNLQMPPRPSSSHSQGMPPQQQQQQQQQGNQNLSIPNSAPPQMSEGNQMPPMQQGGSQPYAGQMQPHGSYKMSPYPPQSQYSQGNYSPRAQYPGYGGQHPGPPNSQYPRPMQNHVNPQYPPHAPYHQVWPPPPQNSNSPGAMSNHIGSQGKNIGPPQAQSPQQQTPPQQQQQQKQGPPSQQQQQQQQQQQPSVGSPRQLNYLKQHLQHKGGYQQGSTPPPPQGFGNGPNIHASMGPPSHHMGPPTMPPPGTPSSHIEQQMSTGIHHPEGMISQDNGMPSQASHQATSLITTGPDGASLDEASQQSTLSNTSIASGEDPQITPKQRKPGNEMMYHGHPMTPNQANVQSPSTSNMPHGEDFEMASPPWPRTPASPVFNSPPVTTQDSFRSSSKATKSDSLAKLYEMDENPERRGFLDRLLGYMDEIRKPVTACPTISKQPLDLYRLYLYVKERGGFLEVTKNKTWKDVAGLLGIGASSSAAYTLRKHYIKSILPFECQFDRGGIDPGPIILSVEASSKKKTPKPASVPSPGSSNSQDSFPAPSIPGSANASMDGYAGYPPPNQYPPNAVPPDYGQGMQRPPSQSNIQPPHQPGNAPQATNDNINVSNPFEDPVASRAPYQPQQHTGAQSQYPPRPQGPPYQGQYQQPFIGPEQQQPYGPHAAPGQYPPGQNQYASQNRQMYPPYGGPPDEANFRNSAPPQGDYRGYPPGAYPSPGQQAIRPPYGPQQAPPTPNSQQASVPPSSIPQDSIVAPASQPPHPVSTAPSVPNSNTPTSQNQSPIIPPPNQNYPQGQPNPEFYNRQDQINLSSELARELIGSTTSMMIRYSPSQMSNAPPRRHPDFTKDPNQQYPSYAGQRPQMYGGWPPNSGNSQQYRQYPPQGPQQWQNQGPRLPQPPNQWDQNRYPPNQQYGPNQPWQGGPMRPPQRGGKPFAMPPPQGPQPINKMSNQYGPPHMQQMPHHPHQGMPHQMQGPHGSQMQQGQQIKRDIVFPIDCVEATQPLLYRRKRMTRHDVSPVDPWRLFMSLKSGLLSESTWALDVLNVLLYDDATIVYFGLTHLPGLLNLLLEHFQKSLSEMFDAKSPINSSVAAIKDVIEKEEENESKNIASIEDDDDDGDDDDVECKNNKKIGGDNKLSSNLVNNSDTGDTRCNKKPNEKQMPANREEQDSSVDLGSVTDVPNPNEHIVLLKSYNYTMQSRKGVPVKLQDSSNDIFVMDSTRKWDKYSNRDSLLKAIVGDDPFNNGNEPSDAEYIMDCFKAEFAHIPFARFIKSSKSDESIAKDRKANNDSKPSPPKRMRLSSEEEREVEELTKKLHKAPTKNAVVVKKETNADADCRQVDMELEKIPNGPLPLESSNESEKIKEEKVEAEKEEICGFDVKSSVKDPAKCLKRKRLSDYEDECYTRDEASLFLITDSQDSLARRCICLSTILRNLTFVPGNEHEFARSNVFLSILGKLLLIHHDHPVRTKKQRNYDREEDADFSDSCSSLQGESEWWWDFLVQIRENMLVSLTNISGYLDLSIYDEPISRPILDGLLHWSVCPSAHGQDPFPTLANNSFLSPQRLALEALCKLCVIDSNVDLVIATPPFVRLEKLCAVLTKHLCKNEDQVLREFSVNLLHYLAGADSIMSRIIARQSPCVSYLVAFIEQAEQTALGVANQHGINFLRENPDSMGTSLDMLRRAAGTLLHLAKHPDNRPLFLQQEQRLLGLVMSHILDQQVALIISRVLYQTSRGVGPMMTTQHGEHLQEEIQLKTLPISQKISSIPTTIAIDHNQKISVPMFNSTHPLVPPQNFPAYIKAPQQPPFLTTPTPSKMLNSSDELIKPKLNTINKQITANASNISTPAPPPSSAPSIPQTVTASS